MIATIALVVSIPIAIGCAASDAQRAKVLNERQIDELLAVHNRTVESEDRVVCRYVTDTGSHIKTKACSTVRQIRTEREMARKVHRRQALDK